jgi:hypothetical protein
MRAGFNGQARNAAAQPPPAERTRMPAAVACSKAEDHLNLHAIALNGSWGGVMAPP